MNDFEEFNVTPELTLDPFQEEKKETPQIYQETEPETPEIVLTPEEKNMVSAFAEKIDLANSNMILQYGAGTQKKIADFSEKALENVKTKDLGEVGILLSDVVTELKGFDEEEEKGFLGIFIKGGNKIQTMKVQGEDKVIGRDVTVREMIEEVEKDRVYYYRSGGGMTLSGGECLCQPEFAGALLRAAKERGISTAIESMACAKWETIETILPYLDTYLMDIKHTNPAKHKEFTGRSNELMMENARKVALSGKTRLVIRVPVIPTFNDTVEEIQGIARFADTLPGVDKIHLLPYHRLGQDKYEGLGRPYLMGNVEPPSKEHMETLKKAVHAVCGLDCQIGG